MVWASAMKRSPIDPANSPNAVAISSDLSGVSSMPSMHTQSAYDSSPQVQIYLVILRIAINNGVC